MSGLPVISGRECAKVLSRAGFYLKRQEGSHMVLHCDELFAQVVIPDHRELDKGTKRAVLRQAGVSVDDLLKFLQDG